MTLSYPSRSDAACLYSTTHAPIQPQHPPRLQPEYTTRLLSSTPLGAHGIPRSKPAVQPQCRALVTLSTATDNATTFALLPLGPCSKGGLDTNTTPRREAGNHQKRAHASLAMWSCQLLRAVRREVLPCCRRGARRSLPCQQEGREARSPSMAASWPADNAHRAVCPEAKRTQYASPGCRIPV